MSQIYVKWNKLSKHSEQLESCSRWISEYSNRVNSVKNQLRMSDNVSTQIKACLSSESQNLSNISNEIKSLASTIDCIARMYNETEREMLN